MQTTVVGRSVSGVDTPALLIDLAATERNMAIDSVENVRELDAGARAAAMTQCSVLSAQGRGA